MKRGGNAINQYLIIGGAPKSATTSLFNYLADHPQVCQANRKETYFFAREYDLSNVCILDDTTEAFESYFSHCDAQNKIRIEGTPYTLYSEGAAKKIVALLPNSKILFILRDPVERLLSSYYFHAQRGQASAQGTFDEFLEWQRWLRGKIPNQIEEGCYVKYLSSFFSSFGKNRVYVIFFEEFIKEPVAILKEICVAMEINANFYSNYRFYRHNKTTKIRNNWLNRRVMQNIEPNVARMRARLLQSPKTYKLFENVVDLGRSMFRTFNEFGTEKSETIPDEMLAELVDYYLPYSQALAKVLNRQLPWKSFR